MLWKLSGKDMWTKDKPLEFIHDYLCYLDEGLKADGKGRGLSRAQKKWIGLCLMGILLTNSIYWAKFESMSFMRYTQQALSWMFRKAKLPWDRLLKTSVLSIIHKFGISSGYLVIDDKDINRSKAAKKLHHLHKMKDKKTGGYILGQNVVFLYFVTGKMNLPVGFSFYCPDPVQKKWRSEIKLRRKKGVPQNGSQITQRNMN